MLRKLSVDGFMPTFRSGLVMDPPDALPPMDDLVRLHEELKTFRQESLERVRKMGEDLRVLEDALKRVREREKGKGKEMDKGRREREFTPVLDNGDHKAFGTAQTGAPKPRYGSSVPPSSSRNSLDPRRLADDMKKKKKRRREDDSDNERELQRPRKASPPPQLHPPPKTVKPPVASSKPSPGADFTVPPFTPLLPPRSPIAPPPVAGPSKPTDVHDDFSKAKIPTPININTFYTSIEPWIRNIKEEDVGFLEWIADEVEPYIVPKLGKHYLEVWEEEDLRIYGTPLPGFAATRSGSRANGEGHASTIAPQPAWEPATLADSDLQIEERGHGPLTERLISALLPVQDMTVWKGVKAAEDAMEGRPGGSAAAAAKKEKMNVGDLEERLRDTMRFHGLLDGIPDYTSKIDDPIATALRHAQDELRTVVATNKARKQRLAAIARDRLACQEYLDLRESIDKNIMSTFSKLQKKDMPKSSKKKKKVEVAGQANGKDASTPAVPLPHPASLGLGPDEENTLVVSAALGQLVETRRQWVDSVGGVFDRKEREIPGRIWNIPTKSVYEGLEEDVRRELSKATLGEPVLIDASQRTISKRKERDHMVRG